MKVKNPILRGFYPDPSIVRVGDDYYIANSTFEWWPGVSLHHSKDLVHWEKLPSPLNRQSQLDLRGVGASQGIWAPCLTYDNGTFYLVYTPIIHLSVSRVKRFERHVHVALRRTLALNSSERHIRVILFFSTKNLSPRRIRRTLQ